MNHSLIKYLLLILCSICPELCLARVFDEPFIEDPSQVELCFDNIYSFYDSPDAAYEQEMTPKTRAFVSGGGGEDDLDPGDGAIDDPQNSCNDCPVGNVLPLCLFVMVYGLWKRRRS